MTWYLGITTTKMITLPQELHFKEDESCEDSETITQERGEFAVERQLLALGIEAHAPRKIEFKRQGKRRTSEPVISAYLPGYFFAKIPADLFFKAQSVKGMPRTLRAIANSEVKMVERFLGRVFAENAEAQRIIDSNERAAMCQFTPGDALEILDGPFMDQIVKFARISQKEHDPHPVIEARAELFGQEVKLMLDPLDVRGAA